jgi:hypothetical protein
MLLQLQLFHALQTGVEYLHQSIFATCGQSPAITSPSCAQEPAGS